MSTALDALAAATESARAQTLAATGPTATAAAAAAAAQANAAAANAAAAATATSAAAAGYMAAAGTWPGAGQAPTQLQFGMAHTAAADANAAAAAAAAAAMGRAPYMQLDRRFYPPVPYATAGADFAAAAGPSAEYLAAAGYAAPGFPPGYGYAHLAIPQPAASPYGGAAAAAYGALSSHSSPMLPSAVLNRPPSGMDGNGLAAMNLSSPQLMHDGSRAAGVKQESRPPTPPLASYVSAIGNASTHQRPAC